MITLTMPRKLLSTPTLCLILSPLVLIFPAHAQIYSWTNEAGNTVYSDQQSSEQARPSQPSSPVNYYKAKNTTAHQPQSTSPAEEMAVLNTETELETSAESASKEPSEKQCQLRYQLSCEQVNNWKRYAIEACGNDSRCQDEAYLDRKYRPRTQDELLTIARRAGARNNMMEKKITEFLTTKYTSYCDNQAAMYCHNKTGSQCGQTILAYCKDPRGLQDIFQRYDNLSVSEKKQILATAKSMALAHNNNRLDYDQMISSLLEILISQAALGL